MSIPDHLRAWLLGLGFLVGLLSAETPVAQDTTSSWLDAHRRQPAKQYVGEPISLSLRDADLVEVLRSFAELGRFNLVIQPGVTGKVTVELKNVPGDQALEQILKIHNLGLEITASEMHVGRAAEGQPIAERVIVRLKLRYADTRTIARALGDPNIAAPGPGGAIQALGDNELLIRATRAVLRQFGRALQAIDVPTAADETTEALAQRTIAIWQQTIRPEEP